MPGAFDIVTCMEMLEHVPDPGSTVAACAALAKPGGTLIVSTINRNPKSYLFAIVGAEYVLQLLPRGTHDWVAFHPSLRARRARPARGPRSRRVHRSRLQPADEGVPARPARHDVNYIAAFRKAA